MSQPIDVVQDARIFNTNDQSSLSNPLMAISTSIHLDWLLDFDLKIIRGTCSHSIDVVEAGTETVDFDSSNLNIESATIGGKDASFIIADVDPQLGSKISVVIPKDLRGAGSSFELSFKYSTGKDASAMQWLEPSATKGGKYPYVFTQSQAIHARSMLPCMDSPGVKTTYTATVKAPEWCTVLMSALADDVSREKKGTFKWRQPVPTSAYLIALAAGDLNFRDISHRVRIWAEPEMVDAAAADFSETEEFLQAAEALTCPYAWTRYDVLCMPPSFPYGGMENPCLTFVTPTLLTGDKSLADVIAHEIAHSWTGNLVTNSTWEHFWLNEGWTVWLERKIMASVKGIDNSKLSAQIGLKHLKDDVAQMGADGAFTSLVWPLGKEDPDDAFSSVPYEKGFCLLYYLENLMGSQPFGEFVKAYIERFKFKTVTSGGFRDFFIEFFTMVWDPLSNPSISEKNRTKEESTKLRREAMAKLGDIEWSPLLLSKGLPADPVPSFENTLSVAAESLARQWIALEGKALPQPTADSKKQMKDWSTQQVNIFLETFLIHSAEKAVISEPLLLALDATYAFSGSKNAEIRFRWQSLCLQSDVAWIVPEVVAFVTSQGRMKYVRPLYKALLRSKNGKSVALQTFEKFKTMYHPIARKMIDADLKKGSTLNSNGVDEDDEDFNGIATAHTPALGSDSNSSLLSTSNAIIALSAAAIVCLAILARHRMK